MLISCAANGGARVAFGPMADLEVFDGSKSRSHPTAREAVSCGVLGLRVQVNLAWQESTVGHREYLDDLIESETVRARNRPDGQCCAWFLRCNRKHHEHAD